MEILSRLVEKQVMPFIISSQASIFDTAQVRKINATAESKANIDVNSVKVVDEYAMKYGYLNNTVASTPVVGMNTEETNSSYSIISLDLRAAYIALSSISARRAAKLKETVVNKIRENGRVEETEVVKVVDNTAPMFHSAIEFPTTINEEVNQDEVVASEPEMEAFPVSYETEKETDDRVFDQNKSLIDDYITSSNKSASELYKGTFAETEKNGEVLDAKIDEMNSLEKKVDAIDKKKRMTFIKKEQTIVLIKTLKQQVESLEEDLDQTGKELTSARQYTDETQKIKAIAENERKKEEEKNQALMEELEQSRKQVLIKAKAEKEAKAKYEEAVQAVVSVEEVKNQQSTKRDMVKTSLDDAIFYLSTLEKEEDRTEEQIKADPLLSKYYYRFDNNDYNSDLQTEVVSSRKVA